MSIRDELGVHSRRKNESQKAFAAYCEYRDMGAERSLSAVSRKLSRSLPFLKRWSSRWEWVKRAEAFDAEMAQKEREAREQLVKDKAAEWAERRQAQLDRAWQKSEELMRRADLMLSWPLQQVERKETITSPDGKEITNITILRPSDKWAMDTAVRMLALGQKLGREGADMPAPGQTITVQGTGEKGAIVVEDTEAERQRNWERACPAIAAMILDQMREAGEIMVDDTGQDRSGTETGKDE